MFKIFLHLEKLTTMMTLAVVRPKANSQPISHHKHLKFFAKHAHYFFLLILSLRLCDGFIVRVSITSECDLTVITYSSIYGIFSNETKFFTQVSRLFTLMDLYKPTLIHRLLLQSI